MLDNASKAFFHLLARSATLKKIASRYGMRRPSSFARRFIAGETVEEAIDASRHVQTVADSCVRSSLPTFAVPEAKWDDAPMA